MSQEIKPGVDLLSDEPGTGEPVEKHRYYRLRLRMWLSRGDPVRWPPSPRDPSRIEEDGAALVAVERVDREQLFAGLFYGIQGMRVGGKRRLRVAPHLAYRETGIPGVIPPNALLEVEVEVLARLENPWSGPQQTAG